MSMKKLLLAGGAAAVMLGSTAYASVIDRPFFKVQGVVVVWGADGVNGNGSIAHDFVLLTPANTGAAGDDLIAADGATVVTGTLDAIIDTDPNSGAIDPNTGLPYPATNPVTGLGGASVGTFNDAGTETGVLDADDTLSTFAVDADTDVTGGMVNVHRSSFYAASNATFNISATSSAFTMTGDFLTDNTLTLANISYDMSLTETGTDGGLTFGTAAQNPGTPVATGTDMSDYTGGNIVFTGSQRTAASPSSLARQSVRFDNEYTLDDGTGNGYDLSMGTGTVQADMTFTVFVP